MPLEAYRQKRNFDQTPDLSCRVIQLLEADPRGNLFFRNQPE